jgi:phosphohistidine phosphatase
MATTSGSTVDNTLISVSPMNRQRTLLLMRHAKSDYPDGVPDHDRPLAPRGVRQAGLAGDWLRANAPAIDGVLCSTATRARQTLANTGVDAPVRHSERLYGATPGTMIDEINETAETVNTLLVIGHEPTISELALILADDDGTDPAAVQRISTKFPTSAIAVLAVPCAWKGVEPGRAALTGFEVPR